MKKYQNVLATRAMSAFVEVLERDGLEATFAAKISNVRRGTVSADILAGRVQVTQPLVVKDCVNECVTQEFAQSMTLSFNLKSKDVAALDAMKAEVDRLFGIAKANLVYGVVPSSSADFAEA